MTQANPVILAGLIKAWCKKAPDTEILTFVQVD